MWGPALSLLLITAPCPEADGPGSAAAYPADIEGQVAVAYARKHMAAGALASAQACLTRALGAQPQSSLAWRAQAQLAIKKGAWGEARAAAEHAAALGDVDPELLELRAMVEGRVGQPKQGRHFAREAATQTADLIAASLDDGDAAYRLTELLGEATPRGALAGLVLAGHALRAGRGDDAEQFLRSAELDARRADAPQLQRVAARLLANLHREHRLAWGARLGLSTDYQRNPAFTSAQDRNHASTARLSTTAELGVELPLGRLRWRNVLTARQHVLLARRSRFCCLDLSAYGLGSHLRLSLGPDPEAVVVGLMVRWTDVFADRLRFHHAAQLEGGPTLSLRLGASTHLELAFLGVYTDFIDTSPADLRVSSINRDRVGQRAILGLGFEMGWIQGRVEAMFLNDDADGDAFDVLGGVLGARFEAQPDEDLTLFTAVSVGLRQYGPVGDRSVIGSAATRNEVRTSVRLGARVRLLPRLELVLQDIYVNNSARAGHGYTDNVLSVGVQTRW